MNKMTEEKFEAFIWSDKFNTGVEVVDTQHRKLVDLINSLGAISTHHASSENLGSILSELSNYTVYHFDTEEELMRQYEVDAEHQIIHIKAHRHFTSQVTVAANILLGKTDVSLQLIAPLLKYLTNWLVQHILGLDTRLTHEILALQVGASHQEATQQATTFMTQAANVLLEALNEMYGKLGDKTLEVIQKNQELEAEHEALRLLNEQLEQRVQQRTADVELMIRQLLDSNVELLKLNEKLESTHMQLLQSEKMASIGQLAAGVAHEINNPVGFVNSNLGTLNKYMTGLLKVIDAFESVEVTDKATLFQDVNQIKKEVDFVYLLEDLPSLLKESQDGLARVTRIVQDLKDFSHVDETNWQHADLEQGMNSTLNVVSNEVKYKATVVKEYAGVPKVECMPSQINQVFMNLLVNAAQSIDEKGTITIRTGFDQNEIWVEVEDTGKGISPENLHHIFEPFFTTKPVGKGTGLGLSLSYGIVQKHNGRIEVTSEVGKGSRFRVFLPTKRVGAMADA